MLDMVLSEKEVFEIVTLDLEEKGYEFVVDCDYDSINQQYESHHRFVGGRIPDILGLSPDNQVIAIEVKGDEDLLKGESQARTYLRDAQISYLAADSNEIESIKKKAHGVGVGTISVNPDETVNWEEGDHTQNLSGLLETRSFLYTRFNSAHGIGEIASMQLAHPANFLLPTLWLANQSPNNAVQSAKLTRALVDEVGMRTNSIEIAIKGASILGFVNGQEEICLTESGMLAATLLEAEGYALSEDIDDLKSETSGNDDLYSFNPIIGELLQQQYRLHPEFNAIYEVIMDFGSDTEINLTDLCEVLIQEYPNVFLEIFCTDKESSQEKAREYIIASCPFSR